MNSTLRAVVGEDQPLVREGIVSMLARVNIEVVASAANADDLIRARPSIGRTW